MEKNERIIAKTIAETEKCFIDESINDKKEYTTATMLCGERFSYQIAYVNEGLPAGVENLWCRIRVEGPCADWVSVQRVESVPVRMPATIDCEDQNFLRRTPGLYPDLLLPPEIYRRCTKRRRADARGGRKSGRGDAGEAFIDKK